MNEYSAHEGEILLERQTSTIKDGDLSKINPDTFLNNQATLLPYTGKCEIDHSKFEVNQLLGGGNFGSVFEGETKNQGCHQGGQQSFRSFSTFRINE